MKWAYRDLHWTGWLNTDPYQQSSQKNIYLENYIEFAHRGLCGKILAASWETCGTLNIAPPTATCAYFGSILDRGLILAPSGLECSCHLSTKKLNSARFSCLLKWNEVIWMSYLIGQRAGEGKCMPGKQSKTSLFFNAHSSVLCRSDLNKWVPTFDHEMGADKQWKKVY